MRTSRITSDNDWTFGRGKANYISKGDAVHQKVKTRLQEFKNDWILDIDRGIDWIDLLGRNGTQSSLKADIEETILKTNGVARIDNLELIVDRTLRSATINVTITDVYSNTFTFDLEVTP